MSTHAGRALDTETRGTGGASALDRWLLRTMMTALPGAGYEVVLWDGSSAGDKTGLRVHIRDRAALWRVVRDPSVHFGDLYAAGRIDVEGDLVTFLESTYAALAAGRAARASAWWNLWTDRTPRSSSIEAARDNIQQHYDLGNDFYALWLDREAMQYTCAYFPKAGMTLEAGSIPVKGWRPTRTRSRTASARESNAPARRRRCPGRSNGSPRRCSCAADGSPARSSRGTGSCTNTSHRCSSREIATMARNTGRNLRIRRRKQKAKKQARKMKRAGDRGAKAQ